MIPSYGKIFHIGHRSIRELFDGPVVAEEKVDGSQFSMMVKDDQLYCRSKGAEIHLGAPQKLFESAVETALALAHRGKLAEGVVYRCEYLAKPKHNTLAYDRRPLNHLALLDVDRGSGYLVDDPGAKQEIARDLSIDCTPTIYHGTISDVDSLIGMLDRVSFLGGQKIEGIVVKNYNKVGEDGKFLMGKYVSEAFKEVHRGEWKKANPTKGDVLDVLAGKYRNEARWNKAVQHLREAGTLQEAVQDIGPLIKEIQADLTAECEDEIKEVLWKWAQPHLTRKCVAGAAEWYKAKLAATQFEEKEDL